MNLTLRQLRYICEVARLGTVLAASRTLLISQSSILAAISAAEAEIGSRIFERFPAKGMRLTEAGLSFVSAASALLAAEIEFVRGISVIGDRVPPVLRIGCFEPLGSLLMPEMLRLYADRFENVEINLFEGNQAQLREWLSAGLIDLAVLYEVNLPPSFTITRICHVPPHAVLHSSDPLAQRGSVTVADLGTRKFVLLDMPETAPSLLASFDTLAAPPPVSFRTQSYEAVLSAVAAGFGASILHLCPISNAQADTRHIVQRPIEDRLPHQTLVIADTFGAMKPFFARTFVELFRKFFRDLESSRFTVAMQDQQGFLIDE